MSVYLFATSERPDQYLNPILHCLQYKNVSKVVFVHIKGLEHTNSNGSTVKERGISAAVLRNVQVLLDSLALAGEYRYFIGKKSGERVKLQDYYSTEQLATIQNTYKQFLDKEANWSHRDIEYLDLRKELANIYRKERGSIFDVTAINKRYLGDILAAGIIEGLKEIYTFDLKITPNFDEPWKMLFHEFLTEKQKGDCYQYVNIVNTPIFRESASSILVRTLPLKISLVIAPILIIILIAINFYYGSTNWAIQTLAIMSTVAGLLSVYYNFFPPRR